MYMQLSFFNNATIASNKHIFCDEVKPLSLATSNVIRSLPIRCVLQYMVMPGVCILIYLFSLF